MRGGTDSYCNLICHDWLISLGGLFISRGKRRRNGSGRKGREGLGGEEGGETGQVIDDRRLKSNPLKGRNKYVLCTHCGVLPNLFILPRFL